MSTKAIMAWTGGSPSQCADALRSHMGLRRTVLRSSPTRRSDCFPGRRLQVISGAWGFFNRHMERQFKVLDLTILAGRPTDPTVGPPLLASSVHAPESPV